MLKEKAALFTIGQFAALHEINKKTLMWYNKNRLGGKSRFSGVSRLSCYYRVNSSVFIGL